jgi:hypothetical protein
MYYIRIRETHFYIRLYDVRIPPKSITYGISTDITPGAFIAQKYIDDLETGRVENSGFIKEITYDIEFAYQITEEEAEEISRKNDEYKALVQKKKDEETLRVAMEASERADVLAKKRYNRWWRRLDRFFQTIGSER